MLIKTKINNLYNRIFFKFYYSLFAWIDPVPWIIDKKSKTILDIGCGQGNPMKMIKKRMHVEYSVGVDIFKPYLEHCKREKIFDKVKQLDVTKLNFPDKSFDIVLIDQVVEHLTKKEAWALVKKSEKIAKKQVIIATPIGKCFHPAVDHNKYQLHKSAYYPIDFITHGYKIVKYGRKSILDEHTYGIAYKVKSKHVLRKLVYLLNILLTPFYYIFQNSCDYIFVAYKKIS